MTAAAITVDAMHIAEDQRPFHLAYPSLDAQQTSLLKVYLKKKSTNLVFLIHLLSGT